MSSSGTERLFLSGNEAVAKAAADAEVSLGTGYPGTPSSEILEAFDHYGGRARWAPNEKVALEVGIGAAFGRARVLVTMKHVGLNVAADPFFSAAYSGVDGGLVVACADDPGMASSQNEQDNRHYAEAAGVPMLEPSDSQEAYDYAVRAIKVSEEWNIPVMLRLTTRICHSRTVVETRNVAGPTLEPEFGRNIEGRVMIPAHARPAHRRLREKLKDVRRRNEQSDLHFVDPGDGEPAIITSGISYMHAREAAPDSPILKLGMTHPLPMDTIRKFVQEAGRCVVIEENDPYLATHIRAEGLEVEGKPEEFRFGELNVGRVRAILDGQTEDEEEETPAGRAPRLCPGCPHRKTFEVLDEQEAIVTGDIGCYTLGALGPFRAMDTQLCMGASIGVGLGLRQVLPEEQARRVVSVIGDSTFVHSGLTGLVEMVYNTPPTGHTVIVVDNGTTAMTGLQEHPATGKLLDGTPTEQLSIEGVAESIGISEVNVVDPLTQNDTLSETLRNAHDNNLTTLIVARRSCVLAQKKARQREKKEAETNA